jgi:ABC-type phosphate/phosphonate transport system substrate-binding protein
MSTDDELLVGAVAYTANVVPIWEGIREFFRDSDAPMDFVLFSNYERQVEALLAGHVEVAWNTNVAWVRTLRRTGGAARALAMRDTDLVFQTLFLGRAGSGLDGLASLRGRRVALGSRDSGQARILPLHYLAQAGVSTDDVDLVIFDSDVGKHGDTGRSDLDALRAVLDDEADVAAVGVNTWRALSAAGDATVADLEVVWESEHYNHCNFTALPSLSDDRAEAWVERLLEMDWEVPEHRRILELEGLKEWKRPELSGYDSLIEAMEAQGVSDHW